MDFCSIASGSSGNCIYAASSQTAVLIDAGISCKRITEGLHSIDRKPEELQAILVTHEHSDHIQGIGVMLRKYHIPVYTTAGTAEYLLQSDQTGRIDPELIHIISPDAPFAVGDLSVEGFRIRHDAAQPVGYRITDGKSHVAVATDMGCYDSYIVDHLKGLDAILLEANHDLNMLQAGPYPYPLKRRIMGEYGHLSNETAGALLCEILHDDMKQVLLGHLSRENNYEALCYATVATEITMGDNPYKADDFPIEIARRNEVSPMYQV